MYSAVSHDVSSDSEDGFERFAAISAALSGKITLRGDCWEWSGYKTKNGYGQKWIGHKLEYTHRIAWAVIHGAPPTGHILHHCDNPSCVRPSHLFHGDQVANNKDMWAKGRGRSGHLLGNNNPKCKYSDEMVAEIRMAYSGGEKQVDIAKRFGVSQATISNLIIRRKVRL